MLKVHRNIKEIEKISNKEKGVEFEEALLSPYANYARERIQDFKNLVEKHGPT